MGRLGLTPDPMQTALAAAEGHTLVVAHRQRGKSRIAAAIALQDALTVEGALILLVSRSMRQAGELFRKVKEFYQVLPTPPMLVKNTEHELELASGSRIISLPGSADTIVGYSSVYRLILEEAARIPDATYHTVRPMIARSGGRLLAISTPFGKRGWFYEAWTGATTAQHALDVAHVEALLADLGFPVGDVSDHEGVRGEGAAPPALPPVGWQKIFAPITYAPQLPLAYIAQERQSIPDLWFRQEWLCEFVDLEGVVFAWDDLVQALSSEVSPLYTSTNQLADDVVEAISPAVAGLGYEGDVWR